MLGLSGVQTRNNVLRISLAPGVKARNAYILGRNGENLGKVRVVNQQIALALGDFREGQELEIVLEVDLPKGEVGVSKIANAKLDYIKANGQAGTSRSAQVELEYKESWVKPSKNPAMKDVLFETQNAGKKS